MIYYLFNNYFNSSKKVECLSLFYLFIEQLGRRGGEVYILFRPVRASVCLSGLPQALTLPVTLICTRHLVHDGIQDPWVKDIAMPSILTTL